MWDAIWEKHIVQTCFLFLFWGIRLSCQPFNTWICLGSRTPMEEGRQRAKANVLEKYYHGNPSCPPQSYPPQK